MPVIACSHLTRRAVSVLRPKFLERNRELLIGERCNTNRTICWRNRALHVSSQLHHSKMPLHHLMIGTWTPPGAIFTVQFDDENLTLKLVKRTEIPHDEPISWMTFDV